MTARKFNALTCEYPDCDTIIRALEGETATELRARAAKENGWSSRHDVQGWIDLCRWHS